MNKKYVKCRDCKLREVLYDEENEQVYYCDHEGVMTYENSNGLVGCYKGVKKDNG